eukprot:3709294-Pleurochrysis_carterae.AAC.3
MMQCVKGQSTKARGLSERRAERSKRPTTNRKLTDESMLQSKSGMNTILLTEDDAEVVCLALSHWESRSSAE